MKNSNIFLIAITALLAVAIVFSSCKKEEEKNQAPTCKITAPSNSQEIKQGTIISIAVDASDKDGSIAEVRFFIDGVGKTSVSSFPYNYVWNTEGESIGNHTIKAIAFDNNGSTTSDEITIGIIAGGGGGGTAPIANFTANPTNGTAPLTANFTDQSENTPTSWQWDFGDGGTSTQQNPAHTYNSAGSYTVTLTATNSYGSDDEAKTNYITVTGGGGGGGGGDLEWVNVPGGTFQMGSPEGTGGSDEHPQHTVTLSSFQITKYEITNGQYCEFLNDIGCNGNGSYNDPEYGNVEYIDMYDGDCQINYSGGQFVPESGLTDYPVIKVTWYGANAYAQWAGGRLPTEAEWEFAARGGNNSNGYTYSGSNNIDDVAWYSNNSGGHTHQVGTKQSNELGIYDMSGNVWEWCRDWYDGNYYSNSPENNPQGPSSGSGRVLRGGCWGSDASYCRVAYRSNVGPGNSLSNLGFRVVLP